MRTMRSLMDRVLGRVVPEISAGAYTQRRCVSGCSLVRLQTRGCHDASGYCGPWTNGPCGC